MPGGGRETPRAGVVRGPTKRADQKVMQGPTFRVRCPDRAAEFSRASHQARQGFDPFRQA